MRYLVTGVDTGVGKTMVGAALLRAASEQGLRCVGVKPIESGCDHDNPDDEDGARLARASGQSQPLRALLRLPAPLAPPLAAEQAGQTIDLDALLKTTDALFNDCDLAVVEGAGGLLSPMTWRRTAVDMAQALKSRAIVVAADRLGVIGQVQLVLSALRQAEIPVDAVVISSVEDRADDHSIGTNMASLRRLSNMPPVFGLPYCSSEEHAVQALLPLLSALMEGRSS